MPFESNVGTFGAESAAGSLAALNRPASCKPCPGAARMSAPPPGCSSPPLLPPGEPAGVRPPCTSIAPPISSTSSLCTAAGGPVCNRQMSATTHPHGPLFNGSESSYPPQNQEPSPTRRGLLRNPIRYWVGRPVFSRQVSLPDRAWADHITRVKVMVKVLDFIQLGGPRGNRTHDFPKKNPRSNAGVLRFPYMSGGLSPRFRRCSQGRMPPLVPSCHTPLQLSLAIFSASSRQGFLMALGSL